MTEGSTLTKFLNAVFQWGQTHSALVWLKWVSSSESSSESQNDAHLVTAIVHVPHYFNQKVHLFFIGPESDHWECLSLTHSLTDSLTHSCLVNLIHVTLACENGNSKLIEVVTVANVDDEDCVGYSFLQIGELKS